MSVETIGSLPWLVLRNARDERTALAAFAELDDAAAYVQAKRAERPNRDTYGVALIELREGSLTPPFHAAIEWRGLRPSGIHEGGKPV